MSMSVRIDPKSGLKIFATRAAKASEKIAGKGYSTVSDEALKTLPPAPAGAAGGRGARWRRGSQGEGPGQGGLPIQTAAVHTGVKSNEEKNYHERKGYLSITCWGRSRRISHCHCHSLAQSPANI